MQVNLPIAPDLPIRAAPRSMRAELKFEASVIRGEGAIVRKQAQLNALSERSGYPGAMDDLVYFIGKPGAVDTMAQKIRSHERLPEFLGRISARVWRKVISRQPVLVLVRSRAAALARAGEEDLVGALLLYEYLIAGFRSRLLTTNDRSGKRSFVGPSVEKPAILEACLRCLRDDGAQVVLFSLHKESGQTGDALLTRLQRFDVRGTQAAVCERSRKAFLLLLETMDATLAQCGQHTRRNLRHYRRKAVAELGCFCVDDVQLDETTFLSFNKDCMYAVPEEVARWRHARLSDMPSATVFALVDGRGRYLSLIGCRRWTDITEIMWQMNVDELTHLSLSIVARSFLIEHEIAHGMRRLQFEGGTGQALSSAFVEEDILDVLMVRRTLLGRMIKVMAKRVVQEGGELGLMLQRKDLCWRNA